MFKRRQWIKVAENIILFNGLYLIFKCHFSFASWEWTWGGTRIFFPRGCCICYTSLSQTCLYSAKLFLPTSSNTAYSLSGIGRFDKILPCPHEDEQEQRLSSASIKFLWLRQIHDPSGISPALDNALSTLLSCCSQHFSCPRSRLLYTSSGGHVQWQRQ